MRLERSIAAYRASAQGHRRRRQFARARAWRGRSVAGLHEERRGSDALRPRRPRIPRLRDVVGRAAARSRASVGLRAVTNAVARGTSFGAPTEQESEFAELIVTMMPSIERLRFVSSGTEATMSAIRLARGFTQPREDPEVRGLLPRSRRFVLDRGRFGGADPRRSRFAGRHGGHCARHDRAAVQRCGSDRERVRDVRRCDRCGDRRALSGEHGAGAAAHAAICSGFASSARATARS